MTAFVIALGLLAGGLLMAIYFAIRHSRRCRAARCPHCCVQRNYYVGYVRNERIPVQDIGPVRCKSCQIFFRFTG